MYTVKNSLNYAALREPPRKFDSRSMTVPDMSMSIETILRKHASGHPILGNAQTPVFNDMTGIDFDSMDLDDRMDYIQFMRDRHYELSEKRRKQEEEAREKKLRKQFESELEDYNQWKSERQQQQEPPTLA